MPHIIEELWNGNIAPCDNCGAGDPDISQPAADSSPPRGEPFGITECHGGGAASQ